MLPILIACLLGGVVFAALAVILTRSKGNTIADALKAMKDGAPESLKLEIGALQKQFKLSTQIPVVALYAISALVALGVPSLMILREEAPAAGKLCEEGEVELSGTIGREEAEGNVYLVPTDLQVQPSGAFKITVDKSEKRPSKDYIIESKNYSPATLTVGYVKSQNQLYISVRDVIDTSLTVKANNSATLGKAIKLDRRRETVRNLVTPAEMAAVSVPVERESVRFEE